MKVYPRPFTTHHGRQDMNLSVLDTLKNAGAITTNSHFVYKSGKHSDQTAENLGVPRLEALLFARIVVCNDDAYSLCAASKPIVTDMEHGDTFAITYPI